MAEDINLFENVTCLEEKSDYRSDWQYLNKSDGNNDHIINSCTLSDEAEEVVDKLAKVCPIQN